MEDNDERDENEDYVSGDVHKGEDRGILDGFEQNEQGCSWCKASKVGMQTFGLIVWEWMNKNPL